MKNKSENHHLKKDMLCMVGVTGIEPVTSSMSTKRSPAELYALKIIVCIFIVFLKVNQEKYYNHAKE